ncbi:MAG: GDSL-type esterase/lipase family protein [Thermoguttaceae bacterium]
MKRNLIFGVLLGVVIAALGPRGAAGLQAAEGQAACAGNECLRGSLANARLQFERARKGHVAFIGGSITEMEGYRPLVCEILKRRFPNTKFVFTAAGIASTCSTSGAFRLHSDVLSQGPVDLFFIEFAVNDDQDAHHARRECIRGLEGILRQARRHNPKMDIVITYFVNPDMMAAYRAGRVPLTIASHEEVARHYGISTIHLAKEVTELIAAGKLTWEKFGGVHPAPLGNAICAGMIDELLSRAWRVPPAAGAATVDYPMPQPLDPLCYANGRFVDPKQAAVKQGWRLAVPAWKDLKGSTRSRFTHIPMLSADEPGAELTLKFTGTAVGAYIVAGPDAGVVEARVDGREPTEVNLLHAFSQGLHYPRTVMLGTDLPPGPHTLVLRISPKTHGFGHAMRIMQFVAN